MEHDKLVDYILPQETSDLTFTETVKLLTELFSPKASLFLKQWKCLNLKNKDGQIWVPMILSASFWSRNMTQQKTPKSDEEF